ncbi:MAG: DUF2235 domain-containing protein [Rhodospirillales bacterium]|nr:DUF2235 domain-containing protein [Rhodospirillales bacterium]
MARLVVFFDGTWNTPDNGSQSTNVVKLLRATPCEDSPFKTRQITFYDRGVGTGNMLDKIVGGASGEGLSENVMDGYRFLANNYMPGDEIYVFGFSRGAYTARSLVGFIAAGGLLHPERLGKDLVKVIEICRNTAKLDTRKKAIQDLNLARYADVRIKCVGVWDTVGSLGIPGDLGRRFLPDIYRFHDVQLSSAVDVALHAVAIDEKRSAFAPTLWVGPKEKPTFDGQIVEQVWFAGVHSNIGGSYADNKLSDITLDWMIKRVRKHTELAISWKDIVAADASKYVDGKGYESRSGFYVDSKLYPYQRLINQLVPEGDGFGEWFRQTFKDYDRRNLVPKGLTTVNEYLHISALQRWNLPAVLHDCPEDSDGKPQPYRPVNLAAVVNAANRGGKAPIDVVGWDGEVDRSAIWP